MNNQYLEVLNLAPGATEIEIKKAYRRLSKQYHPDVSRNENAREKFIEINEAYRFLTDVGPRPEPMVASAPAYDYNAQDHAYDDWRRKAKLFAKRRAQEAVRRQNIMIKSILKAFDLVLILIVSFNIVLVIDSHMTLVAYNDLSSNQPIMKRSSSYYDILRVNNHTLYLRAGDLEDVEKIGTYEHATVYATPLFDKPMYLDLVIRGKNYRFKQYAGVYGFFSFFIKAILLLAVLYKAFFRSLDVQLTLTILFAFLSIFQLYIFLKY